MNIRKVVIPVAGWGTRSLPASKNIPKEMLPIYSKPVIQYVVEEALRAQISNVILVTSREKGLIEDHFDYNLQLESVLERSGKHELLKCVHDVAEMVNISTVRQKKQLGLGHAVLCAKDIVHDNPFAVMVGDDVIFGDHSGMEQLIHAAKKHNMPVLGVMEVAEDKVNRYGIVMGEEIEHGVYAITDMVEKPAIGTVSSRLAIVGRYVLTPDIFTILEEVKPDKSGEIQLTEGLNVLSKKRGMLAVKMDGIRFDAGDWVDYIVANIYFGLLDPKVGDEVYSRVNALLGGSR